MAFSTVSKKSGKTYFLHARLQKLRGGQEVTLYYFAGEAKEQLNTCRDREAATWMERIG